VEEVGVSRVAVAKGRFAEGKEGREGGESERKEILRYGI